jgi:predicted DNA-binding transcriptional regulator YafY
MASAAANRLIRFIKGVVPADRQKEVLAHFDKIHSAAMTKHENELLVQAAEELRQTNIPSKADLKEKEKSRKIKTVKKTK